MATTVRDGNDRLRKENCVGAFDFGALVFIFLEACLESVLRCTEDVDVIFAKNNSPLSTLERGQLISVLDSSSLYKQKFVKPKPLASKIAAVKNCMGQKKRRS